MNILRGLGFGVVALWVLGVIGCATSFTGSAKVPGGPAGCRDVCGSYGMELAGMVAMGEYSDGCICKVKGGDSAKSTSSQLAVAGAAPAAVGVVMAMREREREQQQQHH